MLFEKVFDIKKSKVNLQRLESLEVVCPAEAAQAALNQKTVKCGLRPWSARCVAQPMGRILDLLPSPALLRVRGLIPRPALHSLGLTITATKGDIVMLITPLLALVGNSPKKLSFR